MNAYRYYTNFLSSNMNEIKITKYKFLNDSIHICPYCQENFKFNDKMCISACYHYWCECCNSKLKSDKCGFCKKTINANKFIDTFGDKGSFKNSQFELDLIRFSEVCIE